MVFLCCTVMLFGLIGRLVYLMGFRSDYYYEKAQDLHERERDIKAARGKILDANGKVLADNKTVCTISVIHSQIKEPEKVISMLVKELGMEEDAVRKRVEKVSSIERIKTNVEKEVGDTIRDYELEGVKVDEDYKRYYPYGSLASKVLGFTGGDNQGIIGLEVKYEEVLSGTPGKILTTTDARGVEIDEIGESRVDPVAGDNLQISLDANIQEFVQQAALKVMEEKQADRVSILLMNPQNGEIYACVNVPEFDLNDPFTLNTDTDTSGLDQQQKQDLLNQMWRNPCLNDTYEPGSTFKIITMSAGLEAGVVSVNDRFYCPGYKLVDDRRIHCANRRGHGSQNFIEGAQNSCNPVFIEVGLRLGIDNYYKYFQQFGLMKKTGIDLPGEAGTIMHQKENMGNVELATVAFGQSFQITPIQLATTVSSLINGGNRVTPHFGVTVQNPEGTYVKRSSIRQRPELSRPKPPKLSERFWKAWFRKARGEMPKLRGTRLAAKRPRPRRFPGAPTATSPPSSDLRLRRIPGCWVCVSFTTLRESIMEEQSQLPSSAAFLKMCFHIWELKRRQRWKKLSLSLDNCEKKPYTRKDNEKTKEI